MKRPIPSPVILTSLYGSEPPQPKVPRFGGAYYRKQYEKMRAVFEEIGIRFVRSPLASYRQGKFWSGWEFVNQKWVRLTPYRPHIIWDKTVFSHTTMEMKEQIVRKHFFFCHPKFGQIAQDKFLTALIFSEWSPRTVYIKSPRDLREAFAHIRAARVVFKPNTLSGGKGIVIAPKRDIRPSMLKGPSILQEFIETQGGVPGMAHGRHDLRVEMFNDVVFRSYIRMARPGNLLANLHQGGTGIWIPKSKIPRQALSIIRSMQPRIASLYPLYYTVDFLFDHRGRPWIAEINHTPGVDFPTVGFRGNEADVWKQFGRFLLKEYTLWRKLK